MTTITINAEGFDTLCDAFDEDHVSYTLVRLTRSDYRTPGWADSTIMQLARLRPDDTLAEYKVDPRPSSMPRPFMRSTWAIVVRENGPVSDRHRSPQRVVGYVYLHDDRPPDYAVDVAELSRIAGEFTT